MNIITWALIIFKKECLIYLTFSGWVICLCSFLPRSVNDMSILQLQFVFLCDLTADWFKCLSLPSHKKCWKDKEEGDRRVD